MWYTDSEDEKTNTAIVKFDGIVKGTDYRLIVSIEVSPNPDNPDGCMIRPQSVNFDGTESPSQNDAVEFLYNMFAAYDEGYEDLSELLSSPGDSGNIELPELYANREEGISFQYPTDWEEGNASDAAQYATDENTFAYFLITNVKGWKQPVMIICKYSVDSDTIQKIRGYTLSTLEPEGNMIATDLEDIALSGNPCKKITFTSKDDTSEVVITRYIYFVGLFMYEIDFYATANSFPGFEPWFDAVMNSYTITPIEAITPSQGTDETEPPQDDQTPTATTGFVGSWQDASGACQMEISDADGDDIYTIEATQDLGSGEWREWYLEGAYEQNFGVFCWGNYLELGLREDGSVSGGANYMESNDVIYFGDDGLLHWSCDAVGFDIILTRK